MQFENESINSVLGMDAADWLKSRYGKSKPEERNADIKSWLISGEGNQAMYTGKGKKPISYDDSYGKTHILVKNIQPEVPLWDVRELISAFVPVIYVYRHKFNNKKGEHVVADNVRVTIPTKYNHKNVINVLTDMREGEIILGGRVIYFHQFIEKEKDKTSDEPSKAVKAKAPVITVNPVTEAPKPAEAYKSPAKVPAKGAAKVKHNSFAALAMNDDDTNSEKSTPATGGGAGGPATSDLGMQGPDPSQQEIDDHELAKKLALEVLESDSEKEHVGDWVEAVKGKK
jgi:hypothetical protein